ncbi:hypothetical protein ACWDVV_38620, partial [Streptomyces tendae]
HRHLPPGQHHVDVHDDRHQITSASSARIRDAILERGRRDGVFPAHLPPAVLSAGLEAMVVALLEQVNTGALEDDGTRAAAAILIAAGVPEPSARTVVESVAPAVLARPLPVE